MWSVSVYIDVVVLIYHFSLNAVLYILKQNNQKFRWHYISILEYRADVSTQLNMVLTLKCLLIANILMFSKIILHKKLSNL